jgi:hypothetical protein
LQLQINRLSSVGDAINILHQFRSLAGGHRLVKMRSVKVVANEFHNILIVEAQAKAPSKDDRVI